MKVKTLRQVTGVAGHVGHMWLCLLKRNKVKSRQLEPLHFENLAKSNHKHLTLFLPSFTLPITRHL